jgi:DNA-directed RNA polymerase specialized sigma24 family protein
MIMTAKEFLRRTIKIRREIDEIENRIKETRATYMSPRAIQYNDMPKAHKPTDLSDYYARVEIFVDMLLAKEKELIGVNADIMMTVDRIEDPDERRVLMLRYIDGKSWVAISHAIPCSERSVYYLHGRALRHLDEILQSIAVTKRL